jgi:hypothetical protein
MEDLVKADLDYYIKVCNLLDPIEIPKKNLPELLLW